MRGNGRFADSQYYRDVGIGFARSDPFEHLPLARGKTAATVSLFQFDAIDPQVGMLRHGIHKGSVYLGQSLFALVFGFLGLLLAVPLMASVMVPVKLLYVRDVVGDEVTVPGDEGG